MDFRDLAANETAALLEWVTSRHSRQSVQELTAFREAIGAAMVTLEAALTDSAANSNQAEMSELVSRLVSSAPLGEAKAEASLAEARRQLEAASDQESHLRQQLAAADLEITRLRADAESMARASTHVERALVNAKARIVELTSRTPGSVAIQPGTSIGEVEHLLAVYREIETGTTASSILNALAKASSQYFPRVSLFGVSGNALEGMYQIGFDINKDIKKIIVPLALESILASAVGTETVQALAPADALDSSQLPFGGTSGWRVALPISVNGAVVAAIYADDGTQPAPDEHGHAYRLAVVELLRRHAIAVLAKLTLDLRAVDELRDYARLLLDEVEYIYAADVSAGKQNIELVEQLTQNLRCAQDSFARRLAAAPVADFAASLFEDQLNGLLDTKGASSFGRHLSIAAAAVVKREPPADPSHSQSVAQAS